MTRTAVLSAAGAVVCLLSPSMTFADSSALPMMDRQRSVSCYRDADGLVWRVQCDHQQKVCLYAPNEELDTAGRRARELERAKPCPLANEPLFRRELEDEGYRFVQGRPDAPHGWTRDERGRVFQVNFDLKRRLYIGASYAPHAYDPAEAKRRIEGKRTSIDFGLLQLETFGGPKNPNRHRIRLVEGALHVEPFSADLTLVQYELARDYLAPLLRITTFFGEPARHDLTLNIGLFSEGGAVEVHPAASADSTLWKFGTAHATLDLWQSPALDSYLRARSGIGIERLFTDGFVDRTAITWGSALELDWVVDRAGFHNVQAAVEYELPKYTRPHEVLGRTSRRVKAGVEYEAIVLAINDQPLSLRLGAGGEKRSDIPGVPDTWAFVANTGLRFSLWAPPRPAQ